MFNDFRVPTLRKDSSQREHLVTLFMSFNAVGEIMHKMLVPVLSGVDKKARIGRMTTQTLRLMLVMRAYHQDHGGLPNSLKELVAKKYLNDVPGDPFGPGKLRYSHDRRIIYSVGKDGKDDGGASPADLKKRGPGFDTYRSFRQEKDPTFVIPHWGKTKRTK